jgi:hypothetical protein
MDSMTLLKPDWFFETEPVESWEKHVLFNRKKKNFLKDYYDSPNETTLRQLQVI